MSLTLKQQQILKTLESALNFAQSPRPRGPCGQPRGRGWRAFELEQQKTLNSLIERLPTPPKAAPDFLKTWLGISSQDFKLRSADWLKRKDGWEQRLLEWAGRNPLDSAFEFLAAAALGFYLSEKESNPKIKSYVDAFYYIATCASVGYADIFAVTQTGKAIASLVMIVGPALAAKALDQPQTGTREHDPSGVAEAGSGETYDD